MEKPIVFAGLMPHAPILVPGVGRSNLAQADATAQAMTMVARHALSAHPDTVVLISPHSPRQPGAFGFWHTSRLQGSLGQFGAPEDKVDLPLDRIFTDWLELEVERRGLRTWRITHDRLDHGALVPLWYLTKAGWSGPTVILGLNYSGEGGLDELGQAIATTARELRRRTALIASGDMSHRLKHGAPAGYDPDAHRFDEAFVGHLRAGTYRKITQLDPQLQEKAAEDVVDSTQVALAATGYRTAGHEVLSYEGPFGVGYGVAILFEPTKIGGAHLATHVRADEPVSHFAELPKVARCAVKAKLHNGPEQPPFRAAGELAERGAVFVTVRTATGELRGCRGVTAASEEDLVRETWHSAVAAALFDPRFPSVTAEDLSQMRFTVTVLGPLESVDSPAELNPAIYGVLMSADDGRRGVLLPAIEGIDTTEDQLAVVRRKAGIDANESVHLERFTARCFSEPAGPQGD